MKILFVHFCKTKNIGDIMSAPYHYFDWQKHFAGRMNIVGQNFDGLTYDAVIYGGGAVGQSIRHGERTKRRPKAPKYVAWGIGRTLKSWKPGDAIPSMPTGLDLMGFRDYGLKETATAMHVPCVSCMHPGFLRPRAVTRPVVGFFNASKPPFRYGNISSYMGNNRAMSETLDFLGSAEFVVTNSYHGAYWSTLLGRKPIIVGAYSSKFHFLPWQTVIVPAGTPWTAGRDHALVHPHALDESIRKNVGFNEKVKECLFAG